MAKLEDHCYRTFPPKNISTLQFALVPHHSVEVGMPIFLFPLKILSVTSSCASASQNSGYIQPCQGSEALTDTQGYYGLAGDEYVKDEN